MYGQFVETRKAVIVLFFLIKVYNIKDTTIVTLSNRNLSTIKRYTFLKSEYFYFMKGTAWKVLLQQKKILIIIRSYIPLDVITVSSILKGKL